MECCLRRDDLDETHPMMMILIGCVKSDFVVAAVASYSQENVRKIRPSFLMSWHEKGARESLREHDGKAALIVQRVLIDHLR